MANAVEMSTMKKLVAQLNQYRHEYYNLNAPSVADDVYDYMYDELLALEERTGVCMANSPTQTVGYPVVSALPKVAHDIPLLSLDKTKSIEDLITFQAGRTVDLSLKLDGLTTELIYENGQLIRLSTRGDGYTQPCDVRGLQDLLRQQGYLVIGKYFNLFAAICGQLHIPAGAITMTFLFHHFENCL